MMFLISKCEIPPSGKQVDDLQDELTNLLFGQEPTSLNMTDQLADTEVQDEVTSRRIVEEELSDEPIAVRSF